MESRSGAVGVVRRFQRSHTWRWTQRATGTHFAHPVAPLMWKSGTCHVLMARAAYVERPAATSRYGDAFAAKKSTLTTLNQISGSAMADKPAFERVKQSQPHPEERPPKSGLPDFGNLNCRNRQQPISMGASRRMATSLCRASILRDAVLRTAPQDEVVDFFTRSSAGWISLQRNRATGRPDIRTTGRVMMEFWLSTRGRVTPTARRV